MITTVQTQAPARVATDRARRTRSGGGFHVADAAADPMTGVHAATGLGGLLALQELPPESSDRRAWSDGMAILQELRALQAGLIGASTTDAGAERIERLLASVTTPSDPRLASLLGQVALRARIELWRRRQA